MKGSYILLIHLPAPIRLCVGRLGDQLFEAGHYCYVGSALNGLESRIQRHLRSEKKIHWHIDYLLRKSDITGIYILESSKRTECTIASVFSKKMKSVSGFGCSDCNCSSHLFHGSEDTIKQVIASLKMRPYALVKGHA